MSQIEATAVDVLFLLYDCIPEPIQRMFNVSVDSDNKSAEIILTMKDGSDWVVTAKKLEEE